MPSQYQPGDSLREVRERARVPEVLREGVPKMIKIVVAAIAAFGVLWIAAVASAAAPSVPLSVASVNVISASDAYVTVSTETFNGPRRVLFRRCQTAGERAWDTFPQINRDAGSVGIFVTYPYVDAMPRPSLESWCSTMTLWIAYEHSPLVPISDVVAVSFEAA